MNGILLLRREWNEWMSLGGLRGEETMKPTPSSSICLTVLKWKSLIWMEESKQRGRREVGPPLAEGEAIKFINSFLNFLHKLAEGNGKEWLICWRAEQQAHQTTHKSNKLMALNEFVIDLLVSLVCVSPIKRYYNSTVVDQWIIKFYPNHQRFGKK